MGKGPTKNAGTCCLCGKANSVYRHPTGLNKWLCRMHINSVLEDMRNKNDTVLPASGVDFKDPVVAEVMRINAIDLSFSERLNLVERTFKIIQ